MDWLDRRALTSLGAVLGGIATIVCACGSTHGSSNFENGNGFAMEGGGLDFAGDGQAGTASPQAPQDDFKQPVLDTGAPSNAPQLFAASDADGGGAAAGGPCLYEPELGSLFPNNWLRPRFRFTTSNKENLFEIKLTIPNEVDPLVIYTTMSGYTMPAATWSIIKRVGVGAPIHLTIRSAVVQNGQVVGGPWTGSDGQVQIAPVSATGSVVYWTTSNGTVLKGFHIGDETVETVLTPTQTGTQCVACHTSTPDGLFVGFTNSTNPGDGSSPAAVDIRSVNGTAAPPSFVTASATALLSRKGQHAPAFSPGHWSAGDHIALSMFDASGGSEIIWTDLEATSQAQGTGWGVIARSGDNNAAASAQLSHDGASIVYTSSTSVNSGANTNDGLVYTVPYAGRMGGKATALAGASDPGFLQYYPVFASDDRFVAFNRVKAAAPTASGLSYNNPAAEIFVVPTAGGTATRLPANDPPACTGKSSPGVTNSWPKWSPDAQTVDGNTYYFLVFASTRDPNANWPQLYATPVVVDAHGVVTSYPALYFWNQPEAEHNHTPAWDKFQIPPVQ
jgi:hypothetical protein